MGLSSELSCEAGNLFCFLSLHRFFQSEALRLYFPPHWNPGLHGLSCSPVVPSGLSTCKCGTARSSSRCLTTSPLRPGCPSPSLLILVWMNVSSLTPWLLDLYTVRFSGSSGYFLVLNLLISLFWLCKEAKYIYLCLCLGQKSSDIIILKVGI